MINNDYPNTPPHVLQKIKEVVPTLPGWVTAERGCELADAVMETRPKLCVELGVFGGRSLFSQAVALKNLETPGMVVGVDPWRVQEALEGENQANREWWAKLDIEAIHRKAMAAIWDHGLETHATVVRNASQHVAQIFGQIDMLFIDGNHAEEPSMRDVELWVPKVRKGGYVVADDADWPSTQKAYARLRELADVVKIGSEVVDGVEQHGRYLVCRKK